MTIFLLLEVSVLENFKQDDEIKRQAGLQLSDKCGRPKKSVKVKFCSESGAAEGKNYSLL